MKVINAPCEEIKSSNNEMEIFTLLSHEVRTPLNAIIGISDLLQKKESEPHRDEYYKILKSTSENLLELVNNILDYSKLKSGSVEVAERTFNLREKLEHSLHSQKLAAISKGLEFNMIFDPRVPELVIGDQVKVAQIFINLVSNSIKFTNTGKLEIQVTLKEEESDIMALECKVIDTGIGIPLIHLDKIFEAFHQGEEDININYAGTGLGLNITRNLIKMLQGSLGVESEVEKGTCFTFILPFGKATDNEFLIGKNREFDLKLLQGKKVLLVEDNKINRIVISRYLELWKINYKIAVNGKEALEEIRADEFDVVLMDVYMPQMSGLEVIEELRNSPEKKYRELPVIALTAAADELITQKHFTSKFNNFITKPFDPERLGELLIVYTNLN